MAKSAIRLLAAAIGIALAAASAITSAHAKPGVERSKRHKVVDRRLLVPGDGFGYSRSTARPVFAPARSPGDVCPGNARSFDCKIWPPPFDDDPDRKMSGTDGG